MGKQILQLKNKTKKISLNCLDFFCWMTYHHKLAIRHKFDPNFSLSLNFLTINFWDLKKKKKKKKKFKKYLKKIKKKNIIKKKKK